MSPSRLHFAAAATVLLLAVIAAAAISADTARRSRHAEPHATQLTGGDPKRAPKILRQFGCAACHTISNIPSPGGLAGPDLSAMSERVYIAGVLPNTPENLVGWIANPQIAKPGSAMPVTGISENEAKDAAAYLLSLR